jgi:hypothetical protein
MAGKNPWLVHVKATVKKHPGMPLKSVLKIAKKSWVKK